MSRHEQQTPGKDPRFDSVRNTWYWKASKPLRVIVHFFIRMRNAYIHYGGVYNGEEDVVVTAPEAVVQSIQNYYMIYLILGLAVTLLVIVIMKFAMNRKNRREKSD